MRGLAIVVISLLSGCASFEPKAYFYPKLGISLVCADENSIDATCRTPGGTTDDYGRPYPTHTDGWTDKNGFYHSEVIFVPACFKTAAREIWMRWGDWCDTMAHELCHAEGLDEAYCADHYPRKG